MRCNNCGSNNLSSSSGNINCNVCWSKVVISHNFKPIIKYDSYICINCGMTVPNLSKDVEACHLLGLNEKRFFIIPDKYGNPQITIDDTLSGCLNKYSVDYSERKI